MSKHTPNHTSLQDHIRPPFSDLNGIAQAKPLSIWGFLAGALVITSPLIVGAYGQAREAKKVEAIKAEYEATLADLKRVNAYLATRNRAMQDEVRRLGGGK